MSEGSTFYNQIAGGSRDRLANLSDGLFSIAMTLLVFDLRVPAAQLIHNDHQLLEALAILAPRLVIYLMSFLTLGIFWVGQQTELNFLARADRDLSWLHIAFLAVIALMPFSTTLLSEHTAHRASLIIYWLNMLLGGLLLYATWAYAERHGLVADTAPAGTARAAKRRLVIGQLLYALAAALVLIHPHWSVGLIVAVQLNFAIAPRLGKLHRV
jgi:uncharacterized membrane protein